MFYQQQYRNLPSVNPHYWSFAITGKLPHPLILSLDDLKALPAQEVRCALVCAGASKDRALIGEADWHGVPLPTLLSDLQIDPAAQYARIRAADGYTTVLPLNRLAQALLVYEMDGSPLPLEHGFPVRLIVPGLYGYKMPKWIERIELSETADGGLWESRGCSLDGDVRITTAILDQQPNDDGSIALSGVAYAGLRSVQSIQISLDGGGWMPIAYTPGTTATLTRWHIDWTPPGSGDYAVRVRAFDGVDSAESRLVIRIRA